MTKDRAVRAIVAMVLGAWTWTSAVPSVAFAQDDDDDEPAPKPKKKHVEEDDDDEEAPKPAPSAPPAEPVAPPAAAAAPPGAAPSTGETAPAGPQGLPKMIFGLERLAGFSYATAAPDQGSDSASLFIINAGGLVLNPFAATRLAGDFQVSGPIYVGGAFSFATSSLSSSSNGSSQDLASLTLYTLTPRIGYAFVLSPQVTIIPRAGVTLAGGSAKTGSDGSGVGVFTTALDLEGAAYYKILGPLSLIGALAVDRTLSASVSQTDSKGNSNSSDIKGTLMTIQAWGGFAVEL